VPAAPLAPAWPDLLSEPPKLHYLAWQDKYVTNRFFTPYLPDGSEVTDAAELKLVRSFQISRLDADPARTDVAKPRFLTLWFSHPAFEPQDWYEVTLLDDSGQPISQPFGESGSLSYVGQQNPNPAWKVHTLSAGAATNLPARLAVRLRYTLGPLEHPQVVSDFRGSMSLLGGSQLNGIGQNSDGRSFVSIAGDTATTQTRRFSVTATTRDGSELQPAGTSTVGNEGSRVLAMRFEFSAPLSNIDHFTIGTRPVRAMEWKDVVLPKN
jgi:hypothetical protein